MPEFIHRSQIDWALPLTSSMTLDKLINLSVPQFPLLYTVDIPVPTSWGCSPTPVRVVLRVK